MGMQEAKEAIAAAASSGATELHLNGNELTEVPAALAQLTNLQILRLDGNQLTEVPAALAQLTNLQRLYLDGNQLTEVPAELAQLTNLQILRLDGNQLTEVPAELAQLTNLQTLYLSGNQLTEVPAELAQLTNGPHERAIDDEDGDGLGSIRRTLAYEEFRRLWRVCRSPLIVVVELCGRNGLRPSEARGLRWECVDFNEKTIAVNGQLNSQNRLTGPKTKRSRRTIPIDDLTIECLDGWRTRQAGLRDRAGELWQIEPSFVISTRYGTPINASNLRRMVTAACEESEVDRIVPYELRHTAVTFQLDQGHAAWKVADWAGTSERMIEEIYRHRLTRVSDLGSVHVPVWE